LCGFGRGRGVVAAVHDSQGTLREVEVARGIRCLCELEESAIGQPAYPTHRDTTRSLKAGVSEIPFVAEKYKEELLALLRARGSS